MNNGEKWENVINYFDKLHNENWKLEQLKKLVHKVRKFREIQEQKKLTGWIK